MQIIANTVGLSKSTASRIVTDVSEALAGKQNKFIVAVLRRNAAIEARILQQGRIPRGDWLHQQATSSSKRIQGHNNF